MFENRGASVGGQVLVSYDTVQNANAAIKTDGKFTIQVKGISTPLKVYSVTGIGTPHSCNLAHHKLAAFWRGRLQCTIQCIEDELVTDQTLRGKIVLLTLDRNLRIELEDKIEPDIPLYSDMEIYLRQTGIPIQIQVTGRSQGMMFRLQAVTGYMLRS